MKTKWTEIIIVVAALLLISIVLDGFAAWDNDLPSDAQSWNTAAGKIRDNWDALEVELGVDLAEAHPYYQSAAPSTKPDGSTALDVDDNGRLWVDSDDDTIYVLSDYSGPTWTNTSAATGVTTGDATFTLQNTDEEDSDGGRQSRFIVKGEQSGGEASTLGYIEFNHDGTSDDQKGQVLIKVNDGDDDNAPSKQAIGYLSTGKIDVSASLSVLDEDDMSSDDDEVVATQQSIKAYVDTQWSPVAYVGGETSTLGNGLIIKMGLATYVSNPQTVTFGTAFPTSCISVTVTRVRAASADSAANVNTVGTSSFQIYNGVSSSVYWIAIGY